MSGYVFVHGPCFACKQLFSYNPNHVPSIWIDRVSGLPPDLGGEEHRARREPLCRSCVERANVERVAKGMEPFPVHEHAYDAEPESEVW